MKARGLGRTRAPRARPGFLNSGLAENGDSNQSGQQTSALTMTIFVAGGIAFAWWLSQEPQEVVPSAPGPA